jgi:hypothetical protein
MEKPKNQALVGVSGPHISLDANCRSLIQAKHVVLASMKE